LTAFPFAVALPNYQVIRSLKNMMAGFVWYSLVVPSNERLSHCHQQTVPFASFLGDHPKAAIDYHFKTGHRETA
jgi:hypothetical protein